MKFQSSNPFTEEILAEYETLSAAEIEEKLLKAEDAFQNWKGSSFAERKEKMLNAAAVLRENQSKYARTISEEMGKTYQSALAEVEKCAWVCTYYAEKAEGFLQDEIIETDAQKSFVSYRPMGLILAVMPWNFPFWQVFRFAAPALMAGNAGVLKHASNVPKCGIFIEEVFLKAGFPEGLFTNLLISSHQVSDIIENPIIKAVTLTGSEKAGAAVASKAAAKIKKAVLELGGSDAYLVLEDADLDLAAKQCASSRLLNSGQSCIGAKRFIIVREVYDLFLEKFKAEMANAKMGDPFDSTTSLAPMARTDLRDELHAQVLASLAKGAKCILGGKVPERNGAFYPATILTDVAPGMPAYDEELFGPVASVICVENEVEAIRIANDSVFGLGACVFTEDVSRGERIAKYALEAGSCFVNQFVKSDPRLPFGGIKNSGFGRELSLHGIREFMNAKTVYLA
ncbi:NAD-dependent succinate-semialdehyde dehydrogenase [Marinilongibacter aquaticus]|uniref:NAD-dependent succinate-semialdehyde dehydrogenase n=1 Tax=Marinilongibacter aquaticus TaxID=2975157 RepID=UPI0021BD267D|nr:NAD-dependent succinate-semialdehyde dehydrogenase [Marinilongibacter aquaticus]UBM57516.1 NAD-dependent succinate-semialdehyde dehydrogenase [Marinilongibacter aquaticus]